MNGAEAPAAQPAVAAEVPTAQPGVELFYRVIVNGGSGTESFTRLKQFHNEMLAILNVNDLGWADIGCDLCDKLKGPAPVTALTFALYRNNTTGMNVFMQSYLNVQSKMGHDTFSMYVDGQPPPGAVCPTNHPECGTRKICIQTGNCDKPVPVGGPCDVCQ